MMMMMMMNRLGGLFRPSEAHNPHDQFACRSFTRVKTRHQPLNTPMEDYVQSHIVKPDSGDYHP